MAQGTEDGDTTLAERDVYTVREGGSECVACKRREENQRDNSVV